MNIQEELNQFIAETENSEEFKEEYFYSQFLLSFTKTMKAKNMTQKELAKAIDCQESYISRIFTRQCNPTINTIRKIMEALELEFHLEPKRDFKMESFSIIQTPLNYKVLKNNTIWNMDGDYNAPIASAA